MLILEIGKQVMSQFSPRDDQEGGFTLIEMMVAIAIMAIIFSVAVLNIPNHDERYWRNDLDHIVSSLNDARDESAMSGNTMLVQIDSQGWRFYGDRGFIPSGTPFVIGSGGGQTSSSVLMQDVYKPMLWNKSVTVEPIRMSLGAETMVEPLQILITQDTRRAIIFRDRYGHFTWLRA